MHSFDNASEAWNRKHVMGLSASFMHISCNAILRYILQQNLSIFVYDYSLIICVNRFMVTRYAIPKSL